MNLKISIRKIWALHRARWSKAIYSMKIEILFDGNKDVLKLSALELYSSERRTALWQIYCEGVHSSLVYLQACCRWSIWLMTFLIQRLNKHDNEALKTTAWKWCHIILGTSAQSLQHSVCSHIIFPLKIKLNLSKETNQIGYHFC